ncbi:MAG: dihydroxyacetone kinase subunit L [Bifidobacteriaceae bacterium]|nr:dihydroxyacetone kinase subunit L [Bifidobacteriaceae bacterium]
MGAGAVGLAGAIRWLDLFGQKVADQRDWLTELDSAIGDADHGANMDRGLKAVAAKLAAGSPPGLADLFKSVGMTLVSSVGGASGPLYGTFFLRLGAAAGPVGELGAAAWGAALRAGLGGIVARGKAELGDKTMVDAMAPALDAYDAALAQGGDAAAGARAALAAAKAGRDATIPWVARKGRASYLGERSAGHMDPGSASTVLLFEALAEALAE